MLADQLGHLEHAHGLLAAEDRLTAPRSRLGVMGFMKAAFAFRAVFFFAVLAIKSPS
jgi:hypothetical protein